MNDEYFYAEGVVIPNTVPVRVSNLCEAMEMNKRGLPWYLEFAPEPIITQIVNFKEKTHED